MNDKASMPENSNGVSAQQENRGGGTQIPRSRDAPDIQVIRKYIKQEYLANEKESLAENSYHVSREHETPGGGTTKYEVERYS